MHPLVQHSGLSGIRDKGLLNSALAKPQQLYHYKPESTLHELAQCIALDWLKIIP